MSELFHRHGLKVTPQRELIFQLLWRADQHPTADSVYAEARTRMPTMSLRTVYQTLNDLAAMGEITALHLGTGSTRFDPDTEIHHHLVCVICGKVRDVHADASSLAVPAAERAGFQVGAAEVVFRGFCDECYTPRASNASQPNEGAKPCPN
jgi:Fe2+ or Zn2+ uptake regulation protein